MKIECFSPINTPSIPIICVEKKNYANWLEQQSPSFKNPLVSSNFEAHSGQYFLSFSEDGALKSVILGREDEYDFWAFGSLSANLPSGHYSLSDTFEVEILHDIYLAWGLGSYVFDRYKTFKKNNPKLVLLNQVNESRIDSLVRSIYWIRNLINTPNQDMGPEELANEAALLANRFNASLSQVVGTDLASQYPSIYAVGRGSTREPRLIDIHWGNPNHPKITIVGKGVCFDSGGYDLKPADGMLTMKKDMAGAAHALGLAQLIMERQLPICLRVLIPAVENLVSGHAYLPGDVLQTRKGLTVEITNTDAEGRLILSDALTEASSQNPELLIDFATLTGAAIIALGGEVGAFFTNRESLAGDIMRHSQKRHDPLWQMPLYQPYKDFLKSPIADLCNAALSVKGAGGAITAALFLESFVDQSIPWIHFDLLAANNRAKPGRPQGGEAMALRTVFSYLEEKYGE